MRIKMDLVPGYESETRTALELIECAISHKPAVERADHLAVWIGDASAEDRRERLGVAMNLTNPPDELLDSLKVASRLRLRPVIPHFTWPTARVSRMRCLPRSQQGRCPGT